MIHACKLHQDLDRALFVHVARPQIDAIDASDFQKHGSIERAQETRKPAPVLLSAAPSASLCPAIHTEGLACLRALVNDPDRLAEGAKLPLSFSALMAIWIPVLSPPHPAQLAADAAGLNEPLVGGGVANVAEPLPLARRSESLACIASNAALGAATGAHGVDAIAIDAEAQSPVLDRRFASRGVRALGLHAILKAPAPTHGLPLRDPFVESAVAVAAESPPHLGFARLMPPAL